MIYVEVPTRAEPRDGVLKEWTQHAGSTLLFTLSASLYESVNGSTTLTSVGVQNVDAGLTIASAALADPLWTAKMSASIAGRYTFELLCTFANGEVLCLEFLVNVINPI